jgi:hypothetical protein
MDESNFTVSYGIGNDRSYTINMPPEEIAKGGSVRCKAATGCREYIPVKEGAGVCACGAKFEIYPAILKRDDDARPDPGA